MESAGEGGERGGREGDGEGGGGYGGVGLCEGVKVCVSVCVYDCMSGRESSGEVDEVDMEEVYRDARCRSRKKGEIWNIGRRT